MIDLVDAGSRSSRGFELDRPAPFTLMVASLAPTSAVLECLPFSGSEWLPLHRSDGTGSHYVVRLAGPAAVVVPWFPTPWGRLTFATAPTTASSITILPVHR